MLESIEQLTETRVIAAIQDKPSRPELNRKMFNGRGYP